MLSFVLVLSGCECGASEAGPQSTSEQRIRVVRSRAVELNRLEVSPVDCCRRCSTACVSFEACLVGLARFSLCISVPHDKVAGSGG